jgi:hypothetical protein
MSHAERKKMIVNAIRKLEDQMVRLKYCEADCDQSRMHLEAEIDGLRNHWQDARSLLVALNEEELTQDAA